MAGALLVLMHECGVRPAEGLAICINSAVPEGKGVSSSAALEVATMSALAAAYGVRLEGRRLALLCQKVSDKSLASPTRASCSYPSSLFLFALTAPI